MNKEDLFQKIGHLKRKTWKPIVIEGDKSPTASKFSGEPYLESGGEWPLCGNCKRPMQLFVQLNLEELPPEFSSESGLAEGLLQMFYCVGRDPTCAYECEAYKPFSKCSLVRIVKSPGGDADSGTKPAVDNALLKDFFLAKTITGWEEQEDYPMYSEIKAHGIHFNAEEEKLYQSIDFPVQGEKLGGWPYWIQDIEYPCCPVCRKKMGFLFQVDSRDNLPYEFGDSGCGHIFRCEEHRDTLAFSWECG